MSGGARELYPGDVGECSSGFLLSEGVPCVWLNSLAVKWLTSLLGFSLL